MIKKSTDSENQANKTVEKSSALKKLKSKLPPVFCESTTREDKLCILSFCCGIIVAACVFYADLYIRNYLKTRKWENQVLQTLQTKLGDYQNQKTNEINGVVIVHKQADVK